MSLEEKTNEVARILKLLSHSKRLLILCKLIKKNRTVGELEEHCAISQSQLSQFLAKMKREKLIESDKK
jgi:DNA-binding HxlR family transcriptional regulator